MEGDCSEQHPTKEGLSLGLNRIVEIFRKEERAKVPMSGLHLYDGIDMLVAKKELPRAIDGHHSSERCRCAI